LKKLEKNLKRKEKERDQMKILTAEITKELESNELKLKSLRDELDEMNELIDSGIDVAEEETSNTFEIEFQELESKTSQWNEVGIPNEEKIEKLKQENVKNEMELENATKSIQEIEKELSKVRIEQEETQNLKISSELKINSLTDTKMKLENKINALEMTRGGNYWTQKLKDEVQKLKQSNPSVHGLLSNLGIVEEKYFTSVNTVLSSILNNTIVVDSKTVALKVINHFNSQKIGFP
jgi:chromosome segregation ATPase